jgi:tryptophan synthase alpha subunit
MLLSEMGVKGIKDPKPEQRITGISSLRQNRVAARFGISASADLKNSKQELSGHIDRQIV